MYPWVRAMLIHGAREQVVIGGQAWGLGTWY
jgi:hypothetical protein